MWNSGSWRQVHASCSDWRELFDTAEDVRYPEFSPHFAPIKSENGEADREEDQVDSPERGKGEFCLRDSQD